MTTPATKHKEGVVVDSSMPAIYIGTTLMVGYDLKRKPIYFGLLKKDGSLQSQKEPWECFFTNYKTDRERSDVKDLAIVTYSKQFDNPRGIVISSSIARALTNFKIARIVFDVLRVPGQMNLQFKLIELNDRLQPKWSDGKRTKKESI